MDKLTKKGLDGTQLKTIALALMVLIFFLFGGIWMARSATPCAMRLPCAMFPRGLSCTTARRIAWAYFLC